MTNLPTPPIAAGADLRAFQYTPIFRARLFGSAFHAEASDAEWRAGVTLWLKSWDQVPAGSLPTDDINLCRLAELGRDVRTWKRLKQGALHGWYQCDDGRLYHGVIADLVNEALTSKRKHYEKTLNARIGGIRKRLSSAESEDVKAHLTSEIESLSQELSHVQLQRVKPNVTSDVTEDVTSTKKIQFAGKGIEGNVREGNVRDLFREDSERAEPALGSNGHDPPPIPPDPRKQLFDLGKSILGANAGGLINKALTAVGEARVGAILGEMALSTKADPRSYFAAAIGGKNSNGTIEREVIP